MIALIFGSTTGNTSDIAVKVQQQLEGLEVELFDVKDVGLDPVSYYNHIIFAIPTWDYGEVQEDWQDVWDEIDDTDFSGKTVAFVGVGDQFAYAEWFLDAMGMLHDKVVDKGAKVVGHWSAESYDFDESKALTADKKDFVGLGLDEDCQPDLTEQRIVDWCEQIKVEFRQTEAA